MIGKFSFKRKPEENPYEALGRLDKKLELARSELRYWQVKVSNYAIKVSDDIRADITKLLEIRAQVLKEIEERHQELKKLL